MDRKWKDVLAQSKWLASLPETIRASIFANLKSQSLAAGSSVFQRDEQFKGLCCVLSGQLHVSGVAQDGAPLLIAILRPGDWTGFLAALDDGRYAFNVSTVDEARVAILDRAKVRSIFQTDLAAFKFLVQPEIDSSRNIYNYFIEYFGRPPISRVAERLIGLGRWPYSGSVEEIAPLDHVSQELLGAATRLSRQTINICLKELAQRGLIKTGYGKVEILDIEGLSDIASGS